MVWLVVPTVLTLSACSKAEHSQQRPVASASTEPVASAAPTERPVAVLMQVHAEVDHPVARDGDAGVRRIERHRSEKVKVHVPTDSAVVVDLALRDGRSVQWVVGPFTRSSDEMAILRSKRCAIYPDWMLEGVGRGKAPCRRSFDLRAPIEIEHSGRPGQLIRLSVTNVRVNPNEVPKDAVGKPVKPAEVESERWRSDGGSWQLRPPGANVDPVVTPR